MLSFAQESGDVEGVLVPFGGDLHAQKRLDVCGFDGQSVEVFEFNPGALSGTKAAALELGQSGARS